MSPTFTTSFNSVTKQLSDFVGNLANKPLSGLTPEITFDDLNNQVRNLGSQVNQNKDPNLSPELVNAYLSFARGLLETAYRDPDEATQCFEQMLSLAEMAEVTARDCHSREIDGKALLFSWISSNIDKESELYRRAEPLINDALERTSGFAPIESFSSAFSEENFLSQPLEFYSKEPFGGKEESTFDPAKISSWRDLSARVDSIAAAIAHSANPLLIADLISELSDRLELASQAVNSYDDPVGPFYGLVGAKFSLVQGIKASMSFENPRPSSEPDLGMTRVYFESALGIADHWNETEGLIAWAAQLKEKHPKFEAALTEFSLCRPDPALQRYLMPRP